MDELIFLFVLAGICVVLLIAMFTYYKHHKKIHDEIKDFNHHAYAIDDVLLNDHNDDVSKDNASIDNGVENNSAEKDEIFNEDLPGSFSASRQEYFDIDDVQLKHDSSVNSSSEVSSTTEKAALDERELVDGVYINTRRVVKNIDSNEPLVEQNESQAMHHSNNHKSSQTSGHKISVVYDPVPEGVKELIISHTILSKDEYFTGTQLFHALESAGLFYGEMDIFHYPGNDDAETFALFSVANVVEPGTFNLQGSEALRTPGISMFMRLPTRMGSYEAYEEFINVAQKIASELDGELCDESRSQLTPQVISYKKEQIRKLNFDMAKAEKLAGTTH